MVTLERHSEPVGTNQFNMWRCITAIAHADGVITPEEKEYLHNIFERMDLTEEQREALYNDLENEKDVGDFLPKVNDPKYRSQIVFFARMLAWKDGDLDPSEDELIKRLHAETVGQLDLEEVLGEKREETLNEMERHRRWLERHRPTVDILKGRFMFAFTDWSSRLFGYDPLLGESTSKRRNLPEDDQTN